MKEFSLIGHPLGHSISPEIHERLFSLSGVEANYQLEDLEPEKLESAIDHLKTLSGFNITIPYKKDIIPYLATIDEPAERYGAVNTVHCEDGELHGYNTDAYGFLNALQRAGVNLEGKVLLCGTGGVSRMMACEALDRGCSLVVASRIIGKAASCVDSLQLLYPNAEIKPSTLNYLSGTYDLILNGTPAGMYPGIKDCPVPLHVARSARAVFDAVYNPAETVLMKTARAAGSNVVGGLTMLVEQAVYAHKLWYGAEFNSEDIDALIADMAKLIKTRFN